MSIVRKLSELWEIRKSGGASAKSKTTIESCDVTAPVTCCRNMNQINTFVCSLQTRCADKKNRKCLISRPYMWTMIPTNCLFDISGSCSGGCAVAHLRRCQRGRATDRSTRRMGRQTVQAGGESGQPSAVRDHTSFVSAGRVLHDRGVRERNA